MSDASNYFHNNAYAVVEKTITFDGGTADAIGNLGGASNPFKIFNTTGTVKMKLYAVCTTDLAGATATLEVGVAGATAVILPLTTATDIDANELWQDATPDKGAELSTTVAENIVVNSLSVIGTVATASVTSGVIRFICEWRPVSSNGKVTVA